MPSSEHGVPPDGGWGWLVVLGSSIVNLFTRAIEPSFGLLFGDLFRELDVGTTGAAIVMSTRDFCINFSGLFLGPLVKNLTYRKVATIGCLFSSVALLSASFASSMTYLLLTYGVLGGFGFGFVQASAFVGINNYFMKKRGQAVGLAMAGTAIGFMAMPQVISLLLQNYDFRSAVLILGALSLNSFVGSSLFQPAEWHLKYPKNPIKSLRKPSVLDLKQEAESLGLLDKNPNKKPIISPLATQRQMSVPTQSLGRSNLALHTISASNRKRSSASSNVSVIGFTVSTVHIHNCSNQWDESKEILVKEKDTGCWSRFSELMDFNLLKDWIYLNILFGLSIAYVAETNFKMIVPFFMNSLGYTLQETAHALSVTAAADLLARLIVPPILDRIAYSKRTTLMISGIFVVISRSALAEQTGTVPLMTCFILNGFFRGVMLINFPLVLSEYATQENFPGVLGLSMVAKAIFTVALGPLIGYVRDYSGSYKLSIHVLSLYMLACIVAWAIEYLFVYIRRGVHPKKPDKLSEDVELKS